MNERRREIRILLYVFEDASGSGLGIPVLVPGIGVRCRIGVWGKDEENEFSNFRDFTYVVETIEEEARNNTIDEGLMFLFNDNSTIEGALYKGNSPIENLFKLVVRLKKVEFQHGATIIVSHLSGKRMMSHGTYGLSRGLIKEGIAQVVDFMTFIPLHLSALERNSGLQDWIRSWVGHEAEFLSPADWFERGHRYDGGSCDEKGFWRNNIRNGTFVWVPAPAAAEVALEEIRKSVLKRPTEMHIFV